ncbi:MAG: type II toxin-antitoxin system VapC family toxin [Limisphaerales bacterium]
MNLLLDTHAFLWFITDDPRLSKEAQALVQAPTNRRLLSMASVWEMAIKVGLGRLTRAQPFAALIPEQLQLNQVDALAIDVAHAALVASLPFHHRDPFDRLLVAQCQVENLALVSCDTAFDAYSIRRLW